MPVDRSPVVRVDEAEALALIALVKVGNARYRQLEQRHRQRVAVADRRYPRDEVLEALRRTCDHLPRCLLHAPFVLLVRRDPPAVHLRLAHRLDEVRLDPLGLDRPGAHERLPEELVLVWILERSPA